MSATTLFLDRSGNVESQWCEFLNDLEPRKYRFMCEYVMPRGPHKGETMEVFLHDLFAKGEVTTLDVSVYLSWRFHNPLLVTEG